MAAVQLLLLLLPLASAQTFGWGPCPDPQVQDNFSLEQYLGRWFEIEKLPASFATGSCIQANYSLRKDGTIRVLNSQVFDGVRESVEGTAVVKDQRVPAKLGVSFSYFTPYSPYWVLSTDYSNYTIVYSCTDVLRVFHVEFAWILSRAPSLAPAQVQSAKDLLVSEGIGVSGMKPTDQSCRD
ncbi:apolipoprotein D-like [Menidia menidia]